MQHAPSLAEPPLPLFALRPGAGPAGASRQARLRARCLGAGAATLGDDEVLELLLAGLLPDTGGSALAQRLLDRFGSVAGAVTAPVAQLRKVEGAGEPVLVALKLAETLATRLARARLDDRPLIGSWDALLEYCRAALAHRRVEHVRLLFLDRRNGLIADEDFGHGTVDQAPLYPREILRRALELEASALILVHNHPSGDPSPSAQDIALTRQLRDGARLLSLELHDHLIIGRTGEFSFRAAGHL